MNTNLKILFSLGFILLYYIFLREQDDSLSSFSVIDTIHESINIFDGSHKVVGSSAREPKICDKSYVEFLRDLRDRESSDNYFAINSLNFIGAYQFGEAALIDLGYVRRDADVYDNDYGGGFTGKNGIDSVTDFLTDPDVQDDAAREWMRIMWHYIEVDGLSNFAWQQIGDVTLSPSGMLAASHLLGPGALRRFVESKGQADIQDPFGTSLRSYIEYFNGYNVPFLECDSEGSFES